MLKTLTLKSVGPATAFGPVHFAQRLNFITGDNGLGKSFLLDIAWWVLTRTWARGVAAVPPLGEKKSSIAYAYSKSTPGDFDEVSVFKRSEQLWPLKKGRPAIPGVVIYAGVDGSFAAWDPARNYWQDSDAADRPKAFNFTPEQVWSGLDGPDGMRHCNGLIHDWVLWQKGQDPAFADLIKDLSVN